MDNAKTHTKIKIVIIACAFPDEEPWWARYINKTDNIELEIKKVPEVWINKYKVLLLLLGIYSTLYRYDVIITEQDGYATFLFSFLNSIVPIKKYKHIVHAFITREKNSTIYSKLKYKFLRFSMSSIDKIVCMSKHEIDYYSEAIGLPRNKFCFCPFFIDPVFLSSETDVNSNYIFSGGRTGRDYKTLLTAISDLPVNLCLVAGESSLVDCEVPANVKIYQDIPLKDMARLMAHSMFVVIPLQRREISIGQTVVLQAMAMGKAVIASRVNAMKDYITEGYDGILVEPNDSESMKQAILGLINHPEYAWKLGAAAVDTVKSQNIPLATIKNMCNIISEISHTPPAEPGA